MVTTCFTSVNKRTCGWVLDKLYFRMERLFLVDMAGYLCVSHKKVCKINHDSVTGEGENEEKILGAKIEKDELERQNVEELIENQRFQKCLVTGIQIALI